MLSLTPAPRASHTPPRGDFQVQLDTETPTLLVGGHRLQIEALGIFGPRRQFGIVLTGYTQEPAPAATAPERPEDYLTDLLLSPEHRRATYQLVDTWGLLICKRVRSCHPSYRDVRGRSSRGRLSQSEYYHHDGCTSPTKPRVVEIRCPYQTVDRHIATAIAPFQAVVSAMIRHGIDLLGIAPDLRPWQRRIDARDALSGDELDRAQGLITRAVRRELTAEAGREFFRQIDELAGAYRQPWEMGESRLISNAHPNLPPDKTMQHRRAYLAAHLRGSANGKLVKRWPAEELE